LRTQLKIILPKTERGLDEIASSFLNLMQKPNDNTNTTSPPQQYEKHSGEIDKYIINTKYLKLAEQVTKRIETLNELKDNNIFMSNDQKTKINQLIENEMQIPKPLNENIDTIKNLENEMKQTGSDEKKEAFKKELCNLLINDKQVKNTTAVDALSKECNTLTKMIKNDSRITMNGLQKQFALLQKIRDEIRFN